MDIYTHFEMEIFELSNRTRNSLSIQPKKYKGYKAICKRK